MVGRRTQSCAVSLGNAQPVPRIKALHRWTERNGGSHDEGEALKRDAVKEKLGNQAVRRSHRGKPAVFGGVYQFEHSAGDFLDLRKQILIEDPAALQCGLASPDNRTKHSWFRILPGFRTRKRANLHFGDTVMVQSMKKSSKLFTRGRDRAVETHLGTELTEEERRVANTRTRLRQTQTVGWSSTCPRRHRCACPCVDARC